MFVAEAAWLQGLLRERTTDEISPLVNLGSSTRRFREVEQPWCERLLFAPLRERGVKIVHVDIRTGDGIDIMADVLDPAERPRLKALKAKAILCCNMLEHVTDPKRLAQSCIDIVGPGGTILVTVPFSYPFHRDPIDTMFRPHPDALARLFVPAIMTTGEILDVKESYRGQVKRRPWILFRHIFRFPFPFIGFESWKRSMAKIYWLFRSYQVTGAVFVVPADSKNEG